MHSRARHGPTELLDGCKRLGPLAVGDGHDLVGDARVDDDTDTALGDDGRPACPGRYLGGKSVPHARPDENLVGALRQGDLDAYRVAGAPRHLHGHSRDPWPVRKANARDDGGAVRTSRRSRAAFTTASARTSARREPAGKVNSDSSR